MESPEPEKKFDFDTHKTMIISVAAAAAMIFILLNVAVITSVMGQAGEVTTVTPKPSLKPTIMPTSTPFPSPAPSPTPAPTILPTVLPTVEPVTYPVDVHGWTPESNITLTEWLYLYNQSIEQRGPHYSLYAKVIDLQQSYGIGEQITARIITNNTGDTIHGLFYRANISIYNRVTDTYTHLITIKELDTVGLYYGQGHISSEIRLSIPEMYMGFDTQGIYHVTISVGTDDTELWQNTYTVVIGVRGQDGMVCYG